MSHSTLLATGVIALLVSGPAQSEISIVTGTNNDLSMYGFLKLDATYQDDGMNSKVAPRFAVDRGPPLNPFQDDGDKGTNLTAMHSRFGLKWAGPQMKYGYKAAGVFEFDLFDGSSNNQMELRTRLAALTLSNGTSTLLFGQHWDLFSPLNVTTLMTNGNLWQTGNLGFRRAQARYTYKGEHWSFAGSINDPSTGGGTSDVDSPLLQGRIGYDWSKVNFGVSGTWGRDDTTVPTESSDIWGVSGDLVINFNDRYSFKGELAWGEDLGVYLSRGRVNPLTGEEQESVSGWGQIVYQGDDWNWWIGGAFEALDDTNPGDFEDTAMGFGALQWKLKAISPNVNPVLFALEVAFFDTDLDGGGNEPDAFQTILSAQYTF